MIILGFKAAKFDKKQNSLLLAHIIHIAHFLNLYGADMRLISCRWVTLMLLLIPSDGDDPMLAQCCTSVVDYGPALNLHWAMVSWSLCGVYTLKDLKPTWDGSAGR